MPSAGLLVGFGVTRGHRSRDKDRVLLERDIEMQRGCSSREGLSEHFAPLGMFILLVL